MFYTIAVAAVKFTLLYIYWRPATGQALTQQLKKQTKQKETLHLLEV